MAAQWASGLNSHGIELVIWRCYDKMKEMISQQNVIKESDFI